MPQITVDEQHYKNLRKVADKMLIALFEIYSEKYFSAGWMIDLEHTIWERSQAKVTSSRELTEHDADLFDILLISQVIDSWVILDNEGEVRTVPMAAWDEIHNRFVAEKSKPVAGD